jgi:hypothetical protein
LSNNINPLDSDAMVVGQQDVMSWSERRSSHSAQ